MALYINTNVASLNAQKLLSRSSGSLENRFEHLATGQKVNSAYDDASGMAISTRTTAQVRGLNQAARNANDGISFLQVADGALDETDNMLMRVRELAVQSANASNNSTDRANIQTEVDELLGEVQRLAETRKFNSKNMLDGTFANQTFRIGEFADKDLTVTIGSATASALGVFGLDMTTASAAEAAITTLDAAMKKVADIRVDLGSYQSRLSSAINNLQGISQETQAMRSQIMDTDVAKESALLTQGSVLQQAGTAVLAQANQQPQLALQLLG
uniref:Flagellin n=1 Tax=Magnetococcus massalia (strain MO-1) TaxID=451514 RepID=I3V6W4_MAGMO|nr:flagellin protein FliC2 [Candidatus Magnetococcus massalia]CRH07693.1 flagellin [Candidatus Magnetococcus massalia]